MRHQALIDACEACAEQCSQCDRLMTGPISFNDCPLCCRACRAACEMVIALSQVGGLLYVQALRMCVSVCEWCANECRQHVDGDFQQCAELCERCRAQCQKALEAEVSHMIQQG